MLPQGEVAVGDEGGVEGGGKQGQGGWEWEGTKRVGMGRRREGGNWKAGLNSYSALGP